MLFSPQCLLDNKKPAKIIGGIFLLSALKKLIEITLFKEI